MSATSLRGMLLRIGGISITALGLAITTTAANAQDETTPQENTRTAPPKNVDEINVTGTLIARPSGTETPIPVTILDSEAIAISGAVNVAEFLRDLPALGPGVSKQGEGFLSSSTAGLNLLDLRRLGTDRTLVLIDGRRHVGSQAGNTAVDVSTIPKALIERVEVITGGASAVYGADAVSGVVNFILNDQFEGVQFDAQTGVTNHGDGFEHHYSATAGTNFSNDRGNVTFSVSYDDVEPILAVDRDFSSPIFLTVPNPDNTGPDDGISDFITVDDNVFVLINDGGLIGVPLSDPGNSVCNNGGTGLFFPGAFGPRDFYQINTETGQPECFQFGTPGFGFFQRGSSASSLINDSAQLQAGVERVLLHGSLNYDLTPNITFFAKGKYAHTESGSLGQPVLDIPFPGFGGNITVNSGNPFLPAALQAAMDLNGLASIPMTRLSTDLGGARTENERNLFQVTVGFSGDIPFAKGIDYDIYYQHGRSRINITTFGRLGARNAIALDAVLDSSGNIVCRASLPSSDPRFVPDSAIPDISAAERAQCSPRNPFAVSSSQSAIDFIMVPFVTMSELKQDVVGAVFTGGLFDLPAGPVQYATGMEWRREKSSSTPDIGSQLGLAVGGTPQNPISGRYDVKEVFGEVLIPIASGHKFAESINIEAAVRLSDYSTIGTTTTYKVGGDWAPTNDIRFRSVYSRSVRAPNIGELFAPETSGATPINDPCDPVFIGAQPDSQKAANRLANCTTLVGNPALFDGQNMIFKPVLTSGNQDLEPEVSKTLTVGVVFTPSFLENFSFTVDYWDIELSSAVDEFPLQTVVDNCVDSASLDNVFCSLVERFPMDAAVSPGVISLLRSKEINVAALETSGIDFEANYGFDLAGGNVNLNAITTYLHKHDFIADATNPDNIDETAGELGRPHWLANFRAQYARDTWSVSWAVNYVGKSVFDNTATDEMFDINGVSAQWYHNIQGRYRLNDNFDFFVGIDNLLNNKPPQNSVTQLGLSFGNAATVYENRGTFFYGGTSINF